MTLKELLDRELFTVLNRGDDLEKELTKPFCCDLLSIAMGKAPAGCVWVTVMANVNTLAVATLADVGCVVMAESVRPDDVVLGKAAEQGITVLSTDLPIFNAALEVYDLIMNN